MIQSLCAGWARRDWLQKCQFRNAQHRDSLTARSLPLPVTVASHSPKLLPTLPPFEPLLEVEVEGTGMPVVVVVVVEGGGV